MGSRTIDEGSMDEKGGMNYSEYVAILSGNTDLLDKARLEKKIAGLEGERKAFQRGKGDSRIRLEILLANQASNSDIIARARQDKADFESRVQYDKEGKKLNPLKIDGITGNDPKVIEVGGQYLRLVAISYPITAISFVVSQAFRSTEHVKLPMVATMISLVVNGIFNYLFIFGIGPFPAMGVSGAALATIISRFLEFFILYSVAKKNNYEALDSFKSMMSYNMYFIQRYIKIAFPVIVNETLWGFGVTLQNAIFAKISTDAIAAFNITGTISQLTWVFFIGIGNAAAIIIGKQIGAEDTQKALKYANKFALLMPILAIFIGALLFPLSKVLPVFFDVAPHIMAEATAMLMVLMVVYPLRSFNMCYIVGICRAGGDTVFAAVCDVAAMWCIALPMGFLAGFILHLQPWLVFMFVVSEDIFKAALGVYRIKSKKWLHNVTR